MNQFEAMYATIKMAGDRDYDCISFEEVGVDYAHIVGMMKQMEENKHTWSEAKIGRWFGYIQGVLVANQCATLEEMKQINREHAQPPRDYYHKKRGTYYEVIGEARLNHGFNLDKQYASIRDGEMLVLYRGEDGVYSVRPRGEFEDGRFTKLTE